MSTKRFNLHSSTLVLLILLNTGMFGCDQIGPHERTNTYDPESPDFMPESVDSVYANIQGDSITVLWQDQSEFEEGYLLERALDKNEEFQTVSKLPVNTTSYTEVMDEEPFWIRYRITPFVQNGDSLSGRPIESRNLPFIPLNKVKPELERLSETKVLVSWPVLYDKEVDYVVKRMIAYTPPEENEEKKIALLDTLSSGENSFVDSVAFHAQIQREYSIWPIAGDIEGPKSGVSTINTYMGKPIDFAVEQNGTEGESIVLSWGATSNYPDFIEGFYLEMHSEDETWDTLATLGSDARKYEYTLSDKNLTFSFRLRTITSDYTSPITLSYDSTLVLRKQREIDEGMGHYVALNHAEDLVYYAYGSNSNARLVAWDWEQDRELYSISRPSIVRDIAITPDDDRLLVATGSTEDFDGNLQVIDARTGATGQILINSRTWLAAISPDGQHYVSLQNGIQVRSIDDNSLVDEYTLEEWGGGFRGVEFHPTAPYIAIKTIDQYLEIHNLNTKERVRINNNYTNVLEYDSEGNYLFDGRQILDPINATAKYNLKLVRTLDIKDITLGPADQFYAVWHYHSGHGERSDRDGISIYSPEGNLSKDFETHNGPMEQVVASDTGTHVVTITNDMVEVWTLILRWEIKQNQ